MSRSLDTYLVGYEDSRKSGRLARLAAYLGLI
jgi:hypothetical protein